MIVGAMAVGPEFGPLVALCVGIVARQPRRAGTALGALLLGFLVGMMGTVLFTWAMTATGLVDESTLTGERPLTSFIWQPDALSWIVGFLAGVAGILALTSAKSGALVGVLISVITVPAAANAAVAVAYWVPSEAVGSTVQLLINLASIVLAGVLTLLFERTTESVGGSLGLLDALRRPAGVEIAENASSAGCGTARSEARTRAARPGVARPLTPDRARFGSRLPSLQAMTASDEPQPPCAAARRALAAGCGWPVRALTRCLIPTLAVVVPATECGVCCLPFVKPRVA